MDTERSMDVFILPLAKSDEALCTCFAETAGTAYYRAIRK